MYPLAQYANQLVSTPEGDEPRFAINTVIGAQNDAYKVLQNLASTFRGMTYWAANTVNVTADHGNLDGSDVDPVHLYNNANVIGGIFNYSGTSLKTRSNGVSFSTFFCVENSARMSSAALISESESIWSYWKYLCILFGCPV